MIMNMSRSLQIQIMRKTTNSELMKLGPDEEMDRSLKKLWNEAYDEDPFQKEILTLLRTGIKHSRKISLADCTEVEAKRFFRNRQYVPECSADEPHSQA